MGNLVQSLPCSCIEQLVDHEGASKNDRLDVLKKGAKFTKKAMMGITTQEMTVRLTEDNSTIRWETPGGTFSAGEKGEVDLTIIKTVKLLGESGMQFIGDKNLLVFEMKAADAATRDQWTVALNDLLQSWDATPENRPRSMISAAGTSDKNEYFKMREQEIADRKKAAAEKKEKYNTGGMKHTAQVMANRS